MESLLSEDLQRTLEHRNRIFGIKTDEPWRARRQYESAHGRTASAWFNADPTSGKSLLWRGSCVLVARRSDDCPTAASAAVPAFHDRGVLPEQRGPFDLSFTAITPRAPFLEGAQFDGRLHIFEAHRRCWRRV